MDHVRLRAKTLTLVAVMFGAAVTLGVIFIPGASFAYRNPTLHIVINTVDALVALLVAFLLYGRFTRSRLVRDLLLTFALLVFGFANLLLSVVPTTITGFATDELTTWGSLVTSPIGGIALVAATSATQRVRGRSSGARLLVASFGAVALVGTLVILWESSLPQAIAVIPTETDRPQLTGHPMVFVSHIAVMTLFAVAAFRFTSLAKKDRDELLLWFGAGAVLAAFARLHYLLYPSLYTDFVYTGDVLRLGFYLLLLIGAGTEIASYWRNVAETAVADERRRMARDLHDGLAQELAFMWNDIQNLRRAYPGDQRVNRASASAERSLDESRRAIVAFSRAPNEPIDTALVTAIEQVARRLDARVRLDLATGIEVPARLREDLVRVAREAVTNAARHGSADKIDVKLWRDGSLHLRVSDDGTGFDPAQADGRGTLGIVSMRERVASHGGEFRIDSTLGKGTTVEVLLP